MLPARLKQNATRPDRRRAAPWGKPLSHVTPIVALAVFSTPIIVERAAVRRG